jgi:cell wall-associated NlpC family hydrolase
LGQRSVDFNKMNANLSSAFGGYATSLSSQQESAATAASYGYSGLNNDLSKSGRMLAGQASALSLLNGRSQQANMVAGISLGTAQTSNRLMQVGISSVDRQGNPVSMDKVVQQLWNRTAKGPMSAGNINRALRPDSNFRKMLDYYVGPDNTQTGLDILRMKAGNPGSNAVSTSGMPAGYKDGSRNANAKQFEATGTRSDTVAAYGDKVIEGFNAALSAAQKLDETLTNMRGVLGPLAQAKGFTQGFQSTTSGAAATGAAGLLGSLIGGPLSNLLMGGGGGGGGLIGKGMGALKNTGGSLLKTIGGPKALLGGAGRALGGVGIETGAAWVNQHFGSNPNDNFFQRLGTGLGRTGADAGAGAATAGPIGALAGLAAGVFSMITSGNHYGDKGAEGNVMSNIGSSVLGMFGGGDSNSQVGVQSGGGSGDTIGSVVSGFASGYAGVPYVKGGRGPKGWDCAGFVYWVFKQKGISLPQVSWEQIKHGTPVAGLAQAQAGDLLFFKLKDGHKHGSGACNHVGIYLGGNRMVHAANPRKGTQVVQLSTYYTSQLVAVRRIVGGKSGASNNPQNILSSGAKNANGTGSEPGTGTGGSGANAASAAVSSITASSYGGVSASTYSASGMVSSSILGLMSTGGAAANGGGGGTTSGGQGIAPTDGGGGSRTPSAPVTANTRNPLINYLIAGGFRGDALRKAWAIGMRESHGDAHAFNGNARTGDLSYGLFQINMKGALGPARRKQLGLTRNEQLFDPMTSVKAMYKMSKGGTSWGPWDIDSSGYAHGAQGGAGFQKYYKQFAGAAHTAGLPGYSGGAWRIGSDQIAKIHQGEMILPASVAEAVRTGVRSNLAGGGSGGGKSVVIQVMLTGASESDARALARRVKQILDEDSAIDKIGAF